MNMTTFTQRIRSVMRDNQFTRTSSGHRSGKLDMNKLYKVFAKSTRVFTKQTERKNKKYNILIMVDESGSMEEEMYSPKYETERTKIEITAELVWTLIKALHSNNIDFSVVGYNRRISVRKWFNEKITRRSLDNLRTKIFESPRTYGGCNHDLRAMNLGLKILNETTEGQNICFIFSDGEPACGCSLNESGSSYNEYIREIKTTVKDISKKAAVITVGIGSDEVGEVYMNTKRIDDQEEFMNYVLTSLNKIITRA